MPRHMDLEARNMVYDLQKASMLKRVSAWLLDIILLLVVAVGAMALVSMVVDVDGQLDRLNAIYARYEQDFNIDFEKTADQMTEEERSAYEKAQEAFNANVEDQRAYDAVLNTILLAISSGILIAYVLLEILIPLWLKNGQTLGKKAFGVGVMRTDGVKMTTFMLFVRTILGKYTIETMLPVYLIMLILFSTGGMFSLLLLGLILLLQVIFIAATRTNSAIHDLLACTVTVDLASQMIFESPEELLEYQKKVHEEAANRAEY